MSDIKGCLNRAQEITGRALENSRSFVLKEGHAGGNSTGPTGNQYWGIPNDDNTYPGNQYWGIPNEDNTQTIENGDLLSTGNYNDHFQQGTDIDLAEAEAAVNEYTGREDTTILVQSVFDPEVSHKPTTIDEYAVTVNLAPGQDPRDFLIAMATDMSGTLGGEFENLGEFKNLGDTPAVGQVIDIDVKDGPLFFESPYNAPVMITDIQNDSFSVQTIELDNKEHLLHGTRQWGYEELPDGSYTFYTRAVSVEDVLAAEGLPVLGNAKDGEKAFWTAWVDGVENKITSEGGTVVEGSRIINQTTGPTGNEIWNTLAPQEQETIRNSQVSGLEHRRDNLDVPSPGPRDAIENHAYQDKVREINNTIENWNNR